MGGLQICYISGIYELHPAGFLPVEQHDFVDYTQSWYYIRIGEIADKSVVPMCVKFFWGWETKERAINITD